MDKTSQESGNGHRTGLAEEAEGERRHAKRSAHARRRRPSLARRLLEDRARHGGAKGGGRTGIGTTTQLLADPVIPATELSRLLGAVARGDLTQKLALAREAQPVKGELLVPPGQQP